MGGLFVAFGGRRLSTWSLLGYDNPVNYSFAIPGVVLVATGIVVLVLRRTARGGAPDW